MGEEIHDQRHVASRFCLSKTFPGQRLGPWSSPSVRARML